MRSNFVSFKVMHDVFMIRRTILNELHAQSIGVPASKRLNAMIRDQILAVMMEGF